MWTDGGLRATSVATLPVPVLVLVLIAICALGLAACAPSGDSGGGARGPNLILISVDTLRPDHLGCYGYERPTSPSLDRLAAEGTLFEQAFSPSSWTLPAHTTMLSGLSPRSHGAVRRDLEIPPGIPWLAEILRGAGYATAAVVNAPFVHRRFGFDRGFESYDYVRRGRREHQEAVLAALGRAPKDQPYFLFLHYMSVHSPYRPEAEFQRFAPPAPPTPRITGRKLERLRAELEDGAPALTEEEVGYLAALYDGEILSLDRRLGEVFAALEASGGTERTLVIVTSDHGEEFGEHGGILHNRTLYDEALAVPLILRGPGVPTGYRVPVLAGLVDIVPTALSLLGLGTPTGLDGVNLSRFWRASEVPGQREAASRPPLELWTSAPDGRYLKVGLRSESAKLIVPWAPTADEPLPPERWERYDLVADPGESSRLPALSPEEALEERFRGLSWSVPGSGGPGVELDPEDEKRLETLGYVGG